MQWSEAKRSEAERSGVSGVKADGLPVDLPGVRMARSFGTCSYKGYLASDERKHRRTAAEAYNIFILQ